VLRFTPVLPKASTAQFANAAVFVGSYPTQDAMPFGNAFASETSVLKIARSMTRTSPDSPVARMRVEIESGH
jgi:hypothetical protein